MFYDTPYLNVVFLILKLSADFPPHLCNGSQLKSLNVYFVLFHGKRTSLIFLVKVVFSHFLMFECYVFKN